MQGGERKLTEREAYLVMLQFLEAYWERGEKRSGDIAVLLGSASLVSNGMPLDQALWNDWISAIEKIRPGRGEG
jgi:hypothetical protein